MSIHAELTEEATENLKKQRRNTVASAWMISILAFVLLAVILVTARIIYIAPDEEVQITTTIVPAAITQAPVMTEPKPVSEMPEQSPSMQPEISVLSTNAPTYSSIPPIDDPANPDGESIIKTDISSIGTIPTVVSGGGTPDFGGVDKPVGGSAFVGTFYDTKLLAGGRESGLNEKEFLDLVHEFVTKGWREHVLSRYYKSPTQLYLSHFYIPEIAAEAAPKAFKCPPQVKDKRWVAIYRGQVTAPVGGKFRFVGYGDDCIVVRFNGENVFDYGWYQMGVKANTANSKWKDYLRTGEGGTAEMRKSIRNMGVNIPPVTFYQYSTIPGINNYLGGAIAGKVFEVKKGQTYPMEVLITEIPGGKFSMALLIQYMREGVYKEKDNKTGSPILDLFRTDHSFPGSGASMESARKAASIPYLEASMVWPTTLPE